MPVEPLTELLCWTNYVCTTSINSLVRRQLNVMRYEVVRLSETTLHYCYWHNRMSLNIDFFPIPIRNIMIFHASVASIREYTCMKVQRCGHFDVWRGASDVFIFKITGHATCKRRQFIESRLTDKFKLDHKKALSTLYFSQ